MITAILLHSHFLLSCCLSSSPARGGPQEAPRKHHQDHRLWPGTRNRAHYPHEWGRNLSMDGTRGHQIV